MRNALLAGAMASVACGVVGSLVVVRRITYMAGGIAHCVLGGIGAAVYLAHVHGWTWLQPLHGALVAALLAAAVIGVASLKARERTDTVIGAVWAIGMAAGVLFLAKTPGYGIDLMSYLFGNILVVSIRELWLLAALDAVVIAVAVLFHHQFAALCFDEEFARARGVRVDALFITLLVLTALTTVLLVLVVGIVMMIALLTIPAAIAGRFADRLSRMMIGGAILTAVLTFAGLAMSYSPELPAGATIVAITGAVYLLVIAATRPHGGLRRRC
ncbi:metal ABC transporter permease [bacterium]|nr:metal ABC transporter permease [bacterium]